MKILLFVLLLAFSVNAMAQDNNSGIIKNAGQVWYDSRPPIKMTGIEDGVNIKYNVIIQQEETDEMRRFKEFFGAYKVMIAQYDYDTVNNVAINYKYNIEAIKILEREFDYKIQKQ